MEGSKTLGTLAKLGDELKRNADVLEHALEHQGDDPTAHATHFRDGVIPAMVAVREAADTLEAMMPHDIWPLATYREMLFIK